MTEAIDNAMRPWDLAHQVQVTPIHTVSIMWDEVSFSRAVDNANDLSECTFANLPEELFSLVMKSMDAKGAALLGDAGPRLDHYRLDQCRNLKFVLY